MLQTLTRAPLVSALLMALATLATARPSHALEFTPSTVEKDEDVLLARGQIEPGDALKLKRVLDRDGRFRVLQVDGIDGGDVAEAIRLAGLVRQRGVRVLLTAHCNSACALVFLANPQVSPRGSLGLHSPQIYPAAYPQLWSAWQRLKALGIKGTGQDERIRSAQHWEDYVLLTEWGLWKKRDACASIRNALEGYFREFGIDTFYLTQMFGVKNRNLLILHFSGADAEGRPILWKADTKFREPGRWSQQEEDQNDLYSCVEYSEKPTSHQEMCVRWVTAALRRQTPPLGEKLIDALSRLAANAPGECRSGWK